MLHNEDMRKLIYLSLILIFSASAFADVYNPSPYYNDGEDRHERSTLSNNNFNHYTKIGDTYYAPSGTSYRRDGNQIYGSDGSSYTQFNNTFQNNSNAQSYQINNNLIQPLY